MDKTKWVTWVVAAILILIAGVAVVSAEQRIEVKVEKDGDEEVTVDINGVTETLHLEDLAEGESRTFDVGDHELVVKRVGDALTVITEGHGIAEFDHHGLSENVMVWVGGDDKVVELDGDCDIKKEKVIVMKVAGEGDERNSFTYHIDGDEHTIDVDTIVEQAIEGDHEAIFLTREGKAHQPLLVKTHGLMGDMVKYRCEESGAVLLLKEDDALEDTYVCPATGCLMKRVEGTEHRVIKIKKRVEVDSEE